MFSKSSLLYALMLLTMGATLTSCGEEFPPYWRVDKLRILAIGSDPIVVKQNETATFESLVWAEPGKTIDYQWNWCPFQVSPQERYECPITRDELITQLKEGLEQQGQPVPGDAIIDALVPPFDLGKEPTAELRYPLDQDFILGLCQVLQQTIAGIDNELANQVNIGDCTQGFRVTVVLTVKTDDEGPLTAAKKVVLWTGSEFDQNQNPKADAIEIRLKSSGDAAKVVDRLDWVRNAQAQPGRWFTMPEDAPLDVVTGIPFEIRSKVALDSIETWQSPAPQGSGRERDDPELEVILYRWFVNAGDLSESSSLYKEGLNDIEKASISEFNLEKKPDPCPTSSAQGCNVSIWSVVRDGRLGIDWIERKVNVL